MKIIELEIKGMTCPSCSAAVDNALNELKGIASKHINHAADSGRIEFDDSQISEEEIIAKINEGHYKVVGKEHIKNEDHTPECIECKKMGKEVPNTVFKSNLKVESFPWADLNRKNYICMNPECEVAYYNEDSSIEQSELKRGLWFKKSTQKKIICYCNNIDKEQIRTAIAEHGLESWEDITSHYRSKVIEKCEILNPTGSCCRNTFDKVVGKLKGEVRQS